MSGKESKKKITNQEILFDFPAVPKGRPRFTRRGIAYTPIKTKRFEDQVALIAKINFKRVFTGALSVCISIFSKRPKSSKRLYPTVKPDIDNYGKAILDGMQGILFNDDSQIIDLIIKHRYIEDQNQTNSGGHFIVAICEYE